jgi:cysteine-rich repeat protein
MGGGTNTRLGLGAGLWTILMLGACGGGGGGGSATDGSTSTTMSSTTSVTTSEGTTSEGTTATGTTDEPPTTGMSATGTGTTDVATTTGDIPPMPFCGDGVLDPGEGCDDGAANADDAECTTQCQTASCGDGLVLAGVEGCDDGAANADDGACTLGCAVATCGDMLVQAGVEDCDDGNADDTDACLGTCKAAGCGDGIVGPGEACDDGNQEEDDDCTNSCAPPNCGDGKLQAGQGEECDDGNMVETDACLVTCVAAKCGDGVVQAGVEECDDANLDEADQCTATCKTPTCMDGAKNGAETDVDCGGDCGKCELGDACDANADCGEGLCIANTCKIAKSCKEIKEAAPNSMDGNYQIDPDDGGPINPLQVRCDMDAGMCGYTWIRFDDPALLNDQSAYAAKCAAVGMEVLVTRTKPHAQAFYDWNLSDQANLLNIFPKNNGAQSINNWQGICQGQPCSFWMTDNANGDVGCTNFEPNGDNNTLYRIYRRSAGCTLQGNWNDANNNIAIQGWVVCSPNDC